MQYFRFHYPSIALALITAVISSGCSFQAPSSEGKPPQGEVNARFVATSWDIKFASDVSFDPELWVSTTAVNAEICLIDPVSGGPIVQETFLVGISRSAEASQIPDKSAVSDLKGCLFFTDTVDQSARDAGSYLDRFLLIRGLAPGLNERTEAIAVALNPSETGETFYRDSQRLGPSPRLSARPPYLAFDGLTYDYENPVFEVTPHLQLYTRRRYTAALHTGLFRPSLRDRWQTADRSDLLKPGARVRIRALLFTSHGFEAGQHAAPPARSAISGFSIESAVDDYGRLNFAMELPTEFSQDTLIESRTKFLIELSPLGSNRSALPGAAAYLLSEFRADAGQEDARTTKTEALEFPLERFQTLWDAGTRNAKHFSFSAADTHGTSFSSNGSWKKTPIDMLVEYWQHFVRLNLVFVGNNPPAGWQSATPPESAIPRPSPVYQPLLDAWLATPSSVLRDDVVSLLAPFCSALNPEDKTKCLLAPQTFFHVSTMKIVDHITNPNPGHPEVTRVAFPVTATYFREFMFSKRFLDGRRHIREHASSSAGKVGAGLFENGISYQRAFIIQDEFFESTEASIQEDLRVRLQTQEQINLTAQGKHFRLNAVAKSCLMVRPILTVYLTEANSQAYLFCTHAEPTIHESWYHIGDQWSSQSSPHIDSRDYWQTGWSKLVRGRGHFESFKKFLANGVHSFIFKKIAPLQGGIDPLIHASLPSISGVSLQRDGGIFPGVNDYQELSPLLWNELQIERYTALCEGAEPDPSTSTDADLLRWKQKRLICRCYFEQAASLVTHSSYVRSQAETENQLNALSVKERCLKLARETIQ